MLNDKILKWIFFFEFRELTEKHFEIGQKKTHTHTHCNEYDRLDLKVKVIIIIPLCLKKKNKNLSQR